MEGLFLTQQSLATFPACVLIVETAGTIFAAFTRWNPSWVALPGSIALCIFLAVNGGNSSAINVFLATLNGLLVYSSAAGVGEGAFRYARRNATRSSLSRTRATIASRLFRSWLPR